MVCAKLLFIIMSHSYFQIRDWNLLSLTFLNYQLLSPKTKFTYFPIRSQWHGMMGSTGHLNYFLIEQIGRNLTRSQALSSCSVAKLTVTIISPGINFSIWKSITARFLLIWPQINIFLHKLFLNSLKILTFNFPIIHLLHIRMLALLFSLKKSLIKSCFFLATPFLYAFHFL